MPRKPKAAAGGAAGDSCRTAEPVRIFVGAAVE